jgi:hypothetical protein
VNVVWHFFVVAGIARTLGNEFKTRNTPNIEPEPGKSLGIAMCVCQVCTIIPTLGFVAALPHVILWIVYWVKIADFSRKLDQLPAIGATLFNVQGV